MKKRAISTKRIIIIIAAVILVAFVATMLGLFIPRSIFVAVPDLENVKADDVESIYIATEDLSGKITDEEKIKEMTMELLGYKVNVAAAKPKPNKGKIVIKINKKDGSTVEFSITEHSKGRGGFIDGTKYRMRSGYMLFQFPQFDETE